MDIPTGFYDAEFGPIAEPTEATAVADARRWATTWKKAAKFYRHQAGVFNSLWEERRNEAIALRHQLDLVQQTADDLAVLVRIYNRVFAVVWSQAGNGTRAAIAEALAQVVILDEKAGDGDGKA